VPEAGEDCDDGNAAVGLPVDVWYADEDGDGYGDAGTPATACDQPDRFVVDATDCDDEDPAAWPGAAEVPYDGVDQDCNGEDLVDVDGDGFDAAEVGGDDCDDTDSTVNPAGVEVCNEVDDDCNGNVDEGVTTTWYMDRDGDGYGDASSPIEACERPPGAVANDRDCDDGDPMLDCTG